MAPSLVQFDLAAGEGESVLREVAGGEVAVVEVVHAANDFEEVDASAWLHGGRFSGSCDAPLV